MPPFIKSELGKRRIFEAEHVGKLCPTFDKLNLRYSLNI